jgi:hypothetical protein
VLGPLEGEAKLGMFELEEEAEEDLIPSNGLAGDDEGEGELDGVIELEGFDGYGLPERARKAE